MLSVKDVCVATEPVRGATRTGKAGNGAANGLTVSTDPKSTKRYSSFHVQCRDSQFENMPSRPAPIVHPARVRDPSKAVVVGPKGKGIRGIEPLIVVFPDTLTRP